MGMVYGEGRKCNDAGKKGDCCKSQGFKEAKKKEWNSVHRRHEEAHRQITAQTVMQGSARKAGHSGLEASRRPLRRWVHAAVFSSMIYLLNEIGGTVTC